MEAYEEGVYSLTEFNQRMESRKREISKLEEEIFTLQNNLIVNKLLTMKKN